MEFPLHSGSRFHRPIMGALLILVVAFLASGCSLFGAKSQSVTISTNVPEAKVYVDGELLGEGQTSYPYEIPRRMKTITVTAKADGYADGYKRTSKSLSTLGILDIIGGVFLLVPFIGLVADGAYEQGPSDVAVYLTPLKAGETAVASAAPAARVESPPASPPPDQQAEPATAPPVDGEGERYALIIGISKYLYAGQAGLSDLASAAADAETMRDYLVKDLGWSQRNMKVLLDEEATIREINSVLGDWLLRIDSDDTLLIFWAGHGYGHPSDERRVFFACHDTEFNKPSTGIEMADVKRRILERNPRNVVAFLDTCHSGAFVATRDKTARAPGKAMRESLSGEIPKGWIYFTGAQSDTVAYEISTLENGLFTHYLLRGLRGEADGIGITGEKDGHITMAEMKTYLSENAEEESNATYGVTLQPVIMTDTSNKDIWNMSLK